MADVPIAKGSKPKLGSILKHANGPVGSWC